jgi:hypothetical protein
MQPPAADRADGPAAGGRGSLVGEASAGPGLVPRERLGCLGGLRVCITHVMYHDRDAGDSDVETLTRA